MGVSCAGPPNRWVDGIREIERVKSGRSGEGKETGGEYGEGDGDMRGGKGRREGRRREGGEREEGGGVRRRGSGERKEKGKKKGRRRWRERRMEDPGLTLCCRWVLFHRNAGGLGRSGVYCET